jgi:hypothetical protein
MIRRCSICCGAYEDGEQESHVFRDRGVAAEHGYCVVYNNMPGQPLFTDVAPPGTWWDGLAEDVACIYAVSEHDDIYVMLSDVWLGYQSAREYDGCTATKEGYRQRAVAPFRRWLTRLLGDPEAFAIFWGMFTALKAQYAAVGYAGLHRCVLDQAAAFFDLPRFWEQ